MDSEDKRSQDARVEKLWKSLDTRNEGQLNLNGLRKGLSKIDHRRYILVNGRTRSLTIKLALKNADSLLQDVLKAVDTNKDGHISFSGTSLPMDSYWIRLRAVIRIPGVCGAN